MEHKIITVEPLPDHNLRVKFFCGISKVYDLKPLFKINSEFETLKKNKYKFNSVYVDTGGNGLVWDDKLDISSEEIWEHGI